MIKLSSLSLTDGKLSANVGTGRGGGGGGFFCANNYFKRDNSSLMNDLAENR